MKKRVFLGKVIGHVVSTVKHPAYEGKKILIVRRLNADRKETDEYEIAVDYVGAGVGDIVIAGGAPGAAQVVFNVERAPMKELIMGIVDEV